MSQDVDTVDAIANAVLYEGYVLYPYRPSAIKNRVRSQPPPPVRPGHRSRIGKKFASLQGGPERLNHLGHHLVRETDAHQHPPISARCCDHCENPTIA